MGADLFGSYVATMLAAMVLGNYVIRDIISVNGSFSDVSATWDPFYFLL